LNGTYPLNFVSHHRGAVQIAKIAGIAKN
jgi:hypothetical protein